MYKNYIKLFLLLFAPFLLVMGCEEEEQLPNDVPRVAFSIAEKDLKDINLDLTAGPRIKGTVQSDLGLKKLTYYLVTSSGSQEIQTITEFDDVDSKLYIIDYLPPYTADVVGFRVVATDVQNRVSEGSLPLTAAGGTAGPVLDLPTQTVSANIRPGVDIRPAIKGSASSHWGLASVSYFIVDANGEQAAGEVTDFGTKPNTYSINVTPDYQMGMTGFKVVAVDKRGNQRVHVVPVEVVDAAPGPIVTFEQQSVAADLTVNPKVTPAVSGTAAAFEGLASVKYFLVSGSSEEPFGEVITTFSDPNEYNFNIQPPYRFGVTGVRVEVRDAVGQVQSKTLPVTVTAQDTELSTFNNVVSFAQGVRNDGKDTNISSRDGQTYTLQEGTDPAIGQTIDFITTDSGGDDEIDIFSPSNTSWLPNNYYKDASGPVVWPVMNNTKMWLLDVANPATFFNNATSVDIRNLSVSGDPKDRISTPDPGVVVYFITAAGKKGLLYWKGHEPNTAEGSKADSFTFDIKVLK